MRMSRRVIWVAALWTMWCVVPVCGAVRTGEAVRLIGEEKKPVAAAKKGPTKRGKKGKKAGVVQGKARSRGEKKSGHGVGGKGVVETLVLRLREASAERVAGHLHRLYRGEFPVRVSADEATNVLMVRAEKSVLDQVRRMVRILEEASVERVDATARAVRVFGLSHTDAKGVREMILKLAPFTRGSEPPRVELDRRTNALVINAGAGDWAAIEDIIRAVDVVGE